MLSAVRDRNDATSRRLLAKLFLRYHSRDADDFIPSTHRWQAIHPTVKGIWKQMTFDLTFPIHWAVRDVTM